MKNIKPFLTVLVFLPHAVCAQNTEQEGEEVGKKINLCSNIEWMTEMQGSFSKGKTPLWLNANKHGVSSLDDCNGYLRGSLVRSLESDSTRRWAIGYGLDIVVPVNYTSNFIVQQAFAEIRWKHGVMTIGSKEFPMELKNQSLSSGSQTLGINARPVPQIRLALPDYRSLAFHGWLQFKGHISFGLMTDDHWQHEFTSRKTKYADKVRYHSKAGYLKFGDETKKLPFSVEFGLEMGAEFAGKAYRPRKDGTMELIPTEGGFDGFWHAFIPAGSDATDGEYANIAGNQLGSWVMRVNYNARKWMLHAYFDHFFEDHSQMFLLDYDGYGEQFNWKKKEKSRFFRYALKDMMWGIELNLKDTRWLRNVVFEYLYTKYQSGPYNHDHTMNIPDHVAGMDDYYNHSIYNAWQHWGQVIGNPLYRSPLYNTDGTISVENNRFIAYHLGIDGQPTGRLGYRALATYQRGWGTYDKPFTKEHHSVSFLVEGQYHFCKGWLMKMGYAMDFGSEQMLGHNRGFQLTVSRSGIFNRTQK